MTIKQKKIGNPADKRVESIGRATARLHRLLKELGHTRNLEKSASTMPDARDRLSFIDSSMHEASEKTISAVEASIPLTNTTRDACVELAATLRRAGSEEIPALIHATISTLEKIAANEAQVHHNLLQIMEAQEFRDLAGQMVKKIVDAAVEIETILIEILTEYAPNAQDSLISRAGLTAGPNLKGEKGVADQDNVDDLLASLGL